MKVVIIGGGPAGMMAAISAATEKNEVFLFEKNETCGKKLKITGKGRCNITSSLPIQEFIPNTPGNGRFLYSAYQTYTNQDIISFLEQYGVFVKEERGNRIFPVSDKSQDVLDVFIKRMKELGVKVYSNHICKEILVEENQVIGICYQKKGDAEERKFFADKVVLATGGKSYPTTGSTGDGYKMAEKLGHTVIAPKPSLVPMVVAKESLELCQKMQGLTLKNVGIKIEDMEKQKIIYEDFGEMLFTHFGVSGPTILSGSSYIRRYPNIEELLKKHKIILKINLKPALSKEQLDMRIQRDFGQEKNKQFSNSLDNLLPKKMIQQVVSLTQIPEEKKVCEITKKERETLVSLLQCFAITLESFGKMEEAIITAGGICVKEINPKTMESKLVRGLYFAGEVIDVDSYTGGFNLQIAYSTGFVAGKDER